MARYSGRTREAYAADLRTYLAWCATRQLDPFAATRPHIQIYTRLHRLAKKAGIEHRVGCHSLRHSYITAARHADG